MNIFRPGPSISTKSISITKAAEAGDSTAQYLLGWMYHMGDGVPRDYDRAIAWYLRAAERGNIKAQNNLRIMYSKGIGTERDPYKAALWSIKAAEGGHVESQVSLGQQYLKGNGVTKDLAKAYAWLVIAHKNGDQHWLNIISRLLLRLSLKHEDVEAARAYVVRHQKKEKS